jgi:hypothetical protein
MPFPVNRLTRSHVSHRCSSLQLIMPSQFFVPFLLAGMIITVTVIGIKLELDYIYIHIFIRSGFHQLVVEQMAGAHRTIFPASAAVYAFVGRTCNASRIAIPRIRMTASCTSSPCGKRFRCSVRLFTIFIIL